MDAIGRSLVILGVVFVVVGFLLYASPQIPLLGKLPGDLRIERPGLRLYFPITTCVLLSALLSLGVQLFSRLR
jgi:hypothetical protein